MPCVIEELSGRPANERRQAANGSSSVPGSNTAPPACFCTFTSLPSPYGIGDVGPAALKWIDQLQEAGQSWWQALPLGPTGYGNSPYQSLSSFAGNELLISPDWLIEDGLLRPSECAPPSFPKTAVDYGTVITFKHRLLERAWM